jgi:S1/P1 Nuclease
MTHRPGTWARWTCKDHTARTSSVQPILIHCIADLHMPMHIGDNSDKGGNRTQIRFFN